MDEPTAGRRVSGPDGPGQRSRPSGPAGTIGRVSAGPPSSHGDPRGPAAPDGLARPCSGGLTIASLVTVALIVLTGAAVRLTGSGLGCPDWPSCYQTPIYRPSSRSTP